MTLLLENIVLHMADVTTNCSTYSVNYATFMRKTEKLKGACFRAEKKMRNEHVKIKDLSGD